MENDCEKTQLADGGASATQMMPAPGAEATQMAVTITCPVCHATTPGGEQYCSDCGFLLSSTPVDVGEAPTPEAMAKLVESPGGREYFLNPGGNTIGRENADVLITHPTVSRRHAQLTVAEGKYLLEDFGSTNGTFASDAKVELGQPVEVNPGDELRFGSVSVTLQAPQAVEAQAEVSEPDETQEPEAATQQPVEAAVPEEVATVETEEPPADAAEPTVEPVEVPEERAVLARLIARVGAQEFEIKPGANTIGRRPSNNIMVPDPFTSGSHAVIEAEEGKFTITDLGSTNGTFVNGERLAPNEPKELNNGDEITLGQLAFILNV